MDSQKVLCLGNAELRKKPQLMFCAYLPIFFFFEGAFMGVPEDVRNLSLGAICIFIKGQGFHDGDSSLRVTKA
jgi:hypothetical protein